MLMEDCQALETTPSPPPKKTQRAMCGSPLFNSQLHPSRLLLLASAQAAGGPEVSWATCWDPEGDRRAKRRKPLVR